MICGIGIDAVEIERCERWSQFDRKQLLRIFSLHEIEYSTAIPVKMAERFAARFAAKEAFFKALSTALPGHGLSFFTICRHVQVLRPGTEAPTLQVDWQELRNMSHKNFPAPFLVHLSITHTKKMAMVVVLFEK